MSKFVRSHQVTVNFEGAEVKFTMAPLKYAQAMRIRALQNFDESTYPEEFFKLLLEELPGAILSFEGLLAADGTPVTKDELFTNAYFSRLITEAGAQWLAKNRPGN